MSKNTVKPALTRKRPKRTVENAGFDAFARRILRAYARRVAAGDVEALRSLAQLSTELDLATREAVSGLKRVYSWSEIADRLGVSRQAVQMRYGDKTQRGVLDKRILNPGLHLSVATLVEVFADHHPGSPVPALCPGCGYRYPEGVTDCPTNTVVRPLLFKRRHENLDALKRLTGIQRADLHDKPTARKNRVAVRQAARPAPVPDRPTATLFDCLTGKDQEQ
jgi:DNA-binding Lrp family transcriptional regulator